MPLLRSLKRGYREFADRAAGREARTERRSSAPPPLTPGRERDLLARMSEMEESRTEAPDVTVIIAAYNVADYLEGAVGSATSQTLRNVEVLIVDDHSTDGTLELAVRLAESDPRVRVLRTQENSGGPGVPRNLGIREARASYFTFLDGDDTLETHACKNLLEAAESTGADLTVGRTERWHLSTGRKHKWYGQLFQERRESIRAVDLPELLDDSIAAGKLYRRAFTMSTDNWLLEGVHYEDLVFTARAYAEAGGITVIPSTTYFWHVYPEDERRSITAQKDDLRNLEHRLAALDLVDRALREGPAPELLIQTRTKFLKHDARIYLNQAATADDAWLRGVCALIRPRLEALSSEDWELIDVWARIVYGAVLSRNLEGIRQAVLFSTDGGQIAGRVVESGERLLWQPAGTEPQLPEPGTTAFRLLDLTDTRVLQTPPLGVKPRSAITSVQVTGKEVRFEGTVDDLGEWFTEADLTVRLKLRRRPDAIELPAVRLSGAGAEQIRWRAVWRPGAGIPAVRPQIWDVRMHLTGNFGETAALLQTRGCEVSGIPLVRVPGATGAAFGRSFEFYSTGKGHLAFKLRGAEGALRSADRASGLAARGLRSARKRVDRASDMLALRAGYERFRRLPVDESAVFCESMLGRSSWDSPRYVAERMRELEPGLTVYWTYSGREPSLPHGFVPVRRWSPEYLRRAATAKYVVDNQTLPTFFRKRAEQRYLQTWHGIPLKLMGLDSPEYRFSTVKAQEELLARAAQWDALVSPCDYFERTFVPAYRYSGRLLRGGTPRNDILVSEADRRAQYKRKLGLPLDRAIVLYAPTFRASGSGTALTPAQAMDVSAWAEALGDQTYLLVRAHYLDRIHVPRALHHYALNVSGVPNVNDLYLAADVLLTDYSSVMFDFAALGRPMGFYAYDLEEYRSADRGTYLDIEEIAPGPVLRDWDSLVQAVPALVSGKSVDEERYSRFRSGYCGDEDGTAALRAARWLLAAHEGGAR